MGAGEKCLRPDESPVKSGVNKAVGGPNRMKKQKNFLVRKLPPAHN